MTYDYEITLPGNSAERPEVTSYDSYNEHSVEHWEDVRHLVEESEQETTVIARPPLGP